MIPPEAEAEFVVAMEKGVVTYEKSYDPTHRVLRMDEQPVQRVGETRTPLPATATHPKGVDDEDERRGAASVFMFAEPLAGFRQATARPQRRKGFSPGRRPRLARRLRRRRAPI